MNSPISEASASEPMGWFSWGVPQRALQVANVLYRPAEPRGHSLVGGLALHLSGELVVDAGHLAKLVAPVHRDPYGAALVGHGPLHGLPDPPGGVRGEPPPAVGVELLDGLHQAYVALLDEVLEGQPHPTVLLGYAHHKPEVLLDEPLAGPRVAGLGPLGEVYLLGVREQLALVDAGEVARYEIGGLGRPLRSRASLKSCSLSPSLQAYQLSHYLSGSFSCFITSILYTVYYIIVKYIQQKVSNRMIENEGSKMGEKRSYGQYCTVARALDVVGERWTLLWYASSRLGPSGSRISWGGCRGSGRTSLRRG